MRRHRFRPRPNADAAYAGDYRNDYVGDAKVEDPAGALFLVLGPTGKRFRSPPSTATCSSTTRSRKRRKARMGVSFLIGADGKASGSRSRISTTTEWDAGARRHESSPRVRCRSSSAWRRWGSRWAWSALPSCIASPPRRSWCWLAHWWPPAVSRWRRRQPGSRNELRIRIVIAGCRFFWKHLCEDGNSAGASGIYGRGPWRFRRCPVTVKLSSRMASDHRSALWPASKTCYLDRRGRQPASNNYGLLSARRGLRCNRGC